MKFGVRWDAEPQTAIPAMIDHFEGSLHQWLIALALTYAPQVEAWMKHNASWTDRTGNARQSLQTQVYESPDRSQVVLELRYGNSIFYHVFLELNNAGRYAIITPTVDYWTPLIMNDIRGALS